jgi:hypothetical protein
MSESKQTVVDWLSKELMNVEPNTFGWDKLFEQAKEMEKEQIIHAYNQSWHFRDKPYKTAEGYYNETFGGNNK